MKQKKIKPERFFEGVPERNFENVEYSPYNLPKPPIMKRIIHWITDTVSGDNKAGESIHGILDLFPIPNQIIAKGAKYLFKGKTRQASQEIQKLLTVRNAVSLVLCIAYFAGWITVDQVKEMAEALSELV